MIGLTGVSLFAQAIRFVLMYFYDDEALKLVVGMYAVVLLLVVPVTVLVINAVVVSEVRRATDRAAEMQLNPQQATSTTNSAVPTVMLVTTSLVYVFLNGPHCVFGIVHLWTPQTGHCSSATRRIIYRGYVVAWALMQPIYSYNFIVYVLTGRRFRFELRQLLRCCCRRKRRDRHHTWDSIAGGYGARGSTDDVTVAICMTPRRVEEGRSKMRRDSTCPIEL